VSVQSTRFQTGGIEKGMIPVSCLL
jgi:hypothetical protein